MVEHNSEMNALTWKEVFASLNPSPVFEVVAVLAEGLATNGDESCSEEIGGDGDEGPRKAIACKATFKQGEYEIPSRICRMG